MTTTLRIGFVPLIDCAIPVIAREKGFAEEEGLHLDLVRENAWAAARDKVAYGVLEASHMLAGVPIASTLGLGGAAVAMVAPVALGLGGNAITVSTNLYRRMVEADPEAMAGPRGTSARALRRVIAGSREKLSFATVFPYSTHAYELRAWLVAGGVDPDRDVNLGVIAPPRMASHLEAGWIDGYCVGEPWNLRAAARGTGVIVATKADIWPDSPEKVLALRGEWAEANRETVAALVRALVRAAQWADVPANREELAALLARPDLVGGAADVLRTALLPASGGMERHVFFRRDATVPWPDKAEWLIAQMVRWGQTTAPADPAAVAASVFRCDLYRAAVGGDGTQGGQGRAQGMAGPDRLGQILPP